MKYIILHTYIIRFRYYIPSHVCIKHETRNFLSLLTIKIPEWGMGKLIKTEKTDACKLIISICKCITQIHKQNIVCLLIL